MLRSKRFQMVLSGLLCGLLGASSVAPGNETSTKGTGSAGKSLILTL
jgi:hypothetical protein